MKKSFYYIGCVLLLILCGLCTGCSFKDKADIKIMANSYDKGCEYVIDDPSVVKFKKEYDKETSTTSGVTRHEKHFVFVSLKEGQTNVTIKCKSSNNYVDQEKYSFVVNEDLKISINRAQ